MPPTIFTLVFVKEIVRAGFLLIFLPFFCFFAPPVVRELAHYDLLKVLLYFVLLEFLILSTLYYRNQKNEEVLKKISFAEVIIDTVVISLFLHFFTGINGPLFILYTLLILGSSFGLSVELPLVIACISSFFVVGEIFLDIFRGASTSLLFSFELAARLLALFFTAYCGRVLARSVILEREKREEAQSLAQSLSESEQKVREQLTELNQRHKFVSLMRRLDQIIMNTLELSEMAQKIVDTVSWELGFAGGIIGVLSEKGEALNFLAISQTPEIKKLLISWDKPFSSLNLPLADPHYNIIEKALAQRRSITTNSLADIFHQVIPLSDAKTMQKDLQVESLLVYPLSAKGKNIGVLVFLLHEPYSKLSAREIEILDAFSDQSGIALENALLLYQTKETHKELQKSYARLKELDKMKDELVSISSHELRTPMTSVKSYLWMALNKANNLTPKLKKYLERAYASSDRMIKLVEDMLSVSRIDAGRFKLLVKPTCLESLISLVISELTIRAEEKEINFSFVKPKTKLPKALADKDKIQEVIINLLDNALKFTPQKGKIVISCRRRGKMVETSVSDSGPGIPKEDLPKLFQKFGRLEHSFATMAESGGGTGLGLYIAKKIINLHSGKIWVRSQKGKGSTFTFSLRIANAEDTEKFAEAQKRK